MGLSVIGTHKELVNAINLFDASYHADYFSVRALAKEYLLSPVPERNNVNALATVLHVVMKRYGAERQKAPIRRCIPEYEALFLNPTMHALLVFFSANPLSTLNIVAGTRAHGVGTEISDIKLVEALRQLGSGLFTNNTNVTYPMKALMLITAYMPALDSQVKSGLHKSGISGVSATQFLMPTSADGLEGKKVTRLPYILAACYAEPGNRAAIDDAVQASDYRSLASETGRIFDVLLFMQSKGKKPLFKFTPDNSAKWYAIK